MNTINLKHQNINQHLKTTDLCVQACMPNEAECFLTQHNVSNNTRTFHISSRRQLDKFAQNILRQYDTARPKTGDLQLLTTILTVCTIHKQLFQHAVNALSLIQKFTRETMTLPKTELAYI